MGVATTKELGGLPVGQQAVQDGLEGLDAGEVAMCGLT